VTLTKITYSLKIDHYKISGFFVGSTVIPTSRVCTATVSIISCRELGSMFIGGDLEILRNMGIEKVNNIINFTIYVVKLILLRMIK
jgi:hypothetical protein